MKHALTFTTHFAAALLAGSVTANAVDLSVTGHDSIQEALDANPGRMIFVPAGDYTITEKICIRGERAGLFGPGRVVQQNPDQQVIEIEDATGAEIRDLTLTRPEGRMETDCEGILAIRYRDVMIDNVRVIDNRTRSSAIALRECKDSRVTRCLVRNPSNATPLLTPLLSPTYNPLLKLCRSRHVASRTTDWHAD